MSQDFEREVAAGLCELVAGVSEGSTVSAAHHEGSAHLSPAAQSEISLEAEGEAPLSPQLTENLSLSAGVTEVSQIPALQSVTAGEEEADVPHISSDALLENPPNTVPEVSELQPELDVNRTLIPPVVFVSGVVSLSIVLRDPSTLFAIGLLYVLHRL